MGRGQVRGGGCLGGDRYHQGSNHRVDGTGDSSDRLSLPTGGSGDGIFVVQAADLSEMNESDRILATQFGYKPVLKREFSTLSTFSFAVSIGGLFASVATTFIFPLQAGGSTSVVWCWLISGAGCMCLALSVAELISAYPTSGGLYWTVSRLAPKRYVPYISWVTGWLNLLGQLAGLASGEYGAAALLLAAVSISSDFTYLPSINDTVATMVGMVVMSGLVNSVSTYWLEKLTRSYFIIHVLVLVSCVIALLVMATPENGTPKHSAKYVFTNLESHSGWQPLGWSFLFGSLSVSWTMSGYDDTAHIAEEIRSPETKAPWAISMGMLFTYVGGWLFNIVLCFVMGDLDGEDSILNSPVQQPVAQIFYNVLGKTGGLVYTIFAFIILKFGNFSAMQSLARTVFAFSRDELLPLSGVWTKILPINGIPVLAVWVTVLACILINLIGLGSYPAISGVFNTCAIALDWSFCIPIFCKIIFGKFVPGPWHLGKLSIYINIWACAWTAFLSIIFVMPTNWPVTAETMNYASAYLVAILVFSTLYWIVKGGKHYTGPRLQIEVKGNRQVPPDYNSRDGSSAEHIITHEAG